jgi:hypothetical protein
MDRWTPRFGVRGQVTFGPPGLSSSILTAAVAPGGTVFALVHVVDEEATAVVASMLGRFNGTPDSRTRVSATTRSCGSPEPGRAQHRRHDAGNATVPVFQVVSVDPFEAIPTVQRYLGGAGAFSG